jgi:hypothetical protein
MLNPEKAEWSSVLSLALKIMGPPKRPPNAVAAP